MVVAIAVAGCGSSGGSTSGSSSGSSSGAATSAGGVTGQVTVFAAASLTEAFTTLGERFDKAHPGVHVRFSFGASSALAEQISQGAPADVFASASATNMQQVASTGAATSAASFARNVMEIAVPPGNPAGVHGLADLARVKVALCQAQVPCGATARKVLSNAHVTVRPVTLEVDVKSTLSKVELGEVDAGLVYVTDVRAAGPKVTGVPIPARVNASTGYPIAALTRAPNATAARAFVAFVLSPAGRGVLTADGFERP
jgi:molybdate transport system substrate-binding protein